MVLHSDDLKHHRHTRRQQFVTDAPLFFSRNYHAYGGCSFHKRHLLIAPHTHTHTHTHTRARARALELFTTDCTAHHQPSGFVLCIISYGLGVRNEVIHVKTFLSTGFRGLFWSFCGLAALCVSSSRFSAYSTLIVFRVIHFLVNTSGVNNREQRKE